MSSKLKLKPNPTFKHAVLIPVPGADAEAVEFEFRARTQKELTAFAEKIGDYPTDTDLLLDFVAGWDIDAEFNAANVTALLENYPGCGQRILQGYLDENGKARLGN